MYSYICIYSYGLLAEVEQVTKRDVEMLERLFLEQKPSTVGFNGKKKTTAGKGKSAASAMEFIIVSRI